MVPTRIEHASLKDINTFGLAARARLLVELHQRDDVAPALAMVAASVHRPLVLGSGSNVVFAADVARPVLRVCLKGRAILERCGDHAIVEAAAGEPWDPFVRWTLAEGLFGLENLALIPGTVGAAPIQNIGAYGVEMRERFESLDAIDLASGACRRFGPSDCRFGYRDSVFKQPGGERWLIVSVRFRLSRRPALRLDYGELRARLAAAGVVVPTPDDVADAVAAIRRDKLPDPAVLGNAGSFFRNPVVDARRAAALRARFPDLPAWPVDDRVKLSAGWMIERCGWKGARDGAAGVHERHALVLVNHGGATGAQIVALAQRIQDSVEASFGVRLEPEPLIVGPDVGPRRGAADGGTAGGAAPGTDMR